VSFLVLLSVAVFLVGHVALAEDSGLDKSPINIVPSMDKWIQRGLEILAILIGLLIVFAGYRLFRLILFISGFVIFYYICYHVLTTQIQYWAEFWVLLISAGAGVLGGFFLLGLGLAAFKIAAFVFGFVGGSMLAYLLLAATPLSGVVKSVAPGSKWEIWIVVGIVLGSGLVVAIIAALISRGLLIIITAFVGAFIIGTAVDALAFSSVESRMLQSIIANGSLPPALTIGWETYLILGGVVVLAVAGMVVQFRGTAKHYHHHHGYHPPEYQPLLSVQDNY